MEGIIALWKERGMTSFDCVYRLRKILNTKKIGHGGTLDPEVDGILPVCVGSATKLIEYMIESGKEYVGEITLGISTTTEDKEGEVVEKKEVQSLIAQEEIDAALRKFQGEIEQVPPMYSAVKVGGKRLYEYARQGKEIERLPRKVTIEELTRTSEPVLDEESKTLRFRFKVKCSKGTYVRTLAVDVGKELGFPAHMSELTRTAAAGLTFESAHTLLEIEEMKEAGDLGEVLLPLEIGAVGFQRVDLTDEQVQNVKNGRVFPIELFQLEDVDAITALYYADKLVALYQRHPSKSERFKPVKVIRTEF
ncbi:MAG: tRNA pseudouridine(55) synthase TruB [Streptococcaceae bacterium]|jgi:tRNA pseudouridine55 synthase|nr:tRNA pseudouridine(55) synthase TruB [Streptococcaceae bacterium]